MSPLPHQSPPPAAHTTLWTNPQRQTFFETWLRSLQRSHALLVNSVRLVSADASFRRYLRVDTQGSPQGPSLIIMDAPPERENCKPFVTVAQLMAEAGIKVPQVLAWDEPNGFMLLTDLGDNTLMQVIDPQEPPPLNHYLDAVDTLVQWQLASREGVLPVYNKTTLLRELELFPHWYVGQHRQFTLDAAQRKVIDDTFAKIVADNLAWPSVYVHRDFMPRNLMVENATTLPSAGASALRLGVLDFQDAVFGPITYDIASLMRDAFLSWEEDFCLDVTIRYWQKARKAGLPVGDDFGEFYKGVEWMGLQRHLRIAGVFARLTLRDGKPRYLADTPRFIDYIRATCSRYMELKPLLRLVEQIEGIPIPTAYSFGRM
jgi:aminoglycoside/choline kinase family phosphotransferase